MSHSKPKMILSLCIVLLLTLSGMLGALTGLQISDETRGDQPRGTTIHVDAENGDDENGDGSAKNPYKTIGKGVNESSNGDTLQVASGTYHENVEVNKTLTIKSSFGNPGNVE